MSESYFKTTVLPELLNCTVAIRKYFRFLDEEKAKRRRRGLAHQDILYAARRTGPDREYGNLIQNWKRDGRILYGYNWYVSQRHYDSCYQYGLENAVLMCEKRNMHRLFHYQSLVDELYDAYIEAASRPPAGEGGHLYAQTKQHYNALPHFDA